MERRAPYPGTQSIRRALALLKAFGDGRPELGLPELTAATGLSRTTAYRLLTALESEGLVERNPASEGYRLGSEMVALGGRARGARDLRTASRAELVGLAEATGETATLEVLLGTDVLILEEAPGRHVVGSMPSVGTRWPAHATSTGKVLMAWLPEPDLRAAAAAPRARLTSDTIVGAAGLRRELSVARERGFAVAWEELEPGFVAVAAAVRDAEGRGVAALSVGGPRSRLSRRRVPGVGDLLCEAAGRVSARLGFRGAEPPRAGGKRKGKGT